MLVSLMSKTVVKISTEREVSLDMRTSLKTVESIWWRWIFQWEWRYHYVVGDVEDLQKLELCCFARVRPYLRTGSLWQWRRRHAALCSHRKSRLTWGWHQWHTVPLWWANVRYKKHFIMKTSNLRRLHFKKTLMNKKVIILLRSQLIWDNCSISINFLDQFKLAKL